MQRGTFVAPSRTTLREFLGLWLDSGKTEVALTTWVSYRLAVRRHRALADAVRWNLIFVNPVSSVCVPKGTTPEQRVWTAAEARQFLDSLVGDRLIALWTLALHTGIRRGELAACDGATSISTPARLRSRSNAPQRTTKSDRPAEGEESSTAAAGAGDGRRPTRPSPTPTRGTLRLCRAWTDSGYLFVDEAGVIDQGQLWTIASIDVASTASDVRRLAAET